MTFEVVGKPLQRVDAVTKVTGRAIYADDMLPARTLHCRILRSPHAHARILSIDTSAARRVPGVVAVITGASKGLGKAMAQALGQAGAKVALVARSREQLEALAGEAFGEDGHKVHGGGVGGELVPTGVEESLDGLVGALIRRSGARRARERALSSAHGT